MEQLLVDNALKSRTIEALRVRVAKLEKLLQLAALNIMSYVESTPILREAAHAKKLEENPEWALILGLGYSDLQRRCLIYQHLGKMRDELKRITGGDALKAKQLADLLYQRVHAGETRRHDNVQKIVEHRRDVAEGIVLSLRQFVHALHDAGGNGHYPYKIRQAQQVIAAAVSKADAISSSRTTVTEIADALGLDCRLISKCEARYDALSNGEWEQLFDDRQAVRSDTMDPEHIALALYFWKDEFLSDADGQAYNFVRRSEKAKDELCDPRDRKSGVRHRIIWLEERIGVM